MDLDSDYKERKEETLNQCFRVYSSYRTEPELWLWSLLRI